MVAELIISFGKFIFGLLNLLLIAQMSIHLGKRVTMKAKLLTMMD